MVVFRNTVLYSHRNALPQLADQTSTEGGLFRHQHQHVQPIFTDQKTCCAIDTHFKLTRLLHSSWTCWWGDQTQSSRSSQRRSCTHPHRYRRSSNQIRRWLTLYYPESAWSQWYSSTSGATQRWVLDDTVPKKVKEEEEEDHGCALPTRREKFDKAMI